MPEKGDFCPTGHWQKNINKTLFKNRYFYIRSSGFLYNAMLEISKV